VVASVIVVAGSAGCPDNGTGQVARGSIALAWSIVDLNHLATTCDRVGASTVVLRMRNRAGAPSIASFPCASSRGTTEVTAGGYDVTLELRAADGSVLASAPDQLGIIVGANQVATLSAATFVASTKGTLAISIAAPPAMANCKSASDGGAGITGNTLTRIHAGGSCAPVTFVRSRGGAQVGTYTVDCGSPLLAACIERDETLTTSVESGAYAVHVRGQLAGTVCWKDDESIVVPPPGGTLTRTLNLTRQNDRGC